MKELIIETKGLTKRYGRNAAVDGVGVHVEKGEIYGLIGKNGAGKTTLMKLLLGMVKKDAGQIKLFGSEDLAEERYRTGSLIEEPGLFMKETAMENLKRFAILNGGATEEELKSLLSLVGLGNTGRKKVREFSLGMRQRLGLAVALLGHPTLMILDEPTNGLDPVGIKEFRDIILKLHEKGVTFMISSHLLDELGRIATRYGIISDGILREELTAEEVQNKCGKYISILADDKDKAIELLSGMMDPSLIEVHDEDIRLLTADLDVAMINKNLVEAGIGIYGIARKNYSMEKFFVERLG